MDDKYTDEELASIIENEGIGYSVQYYLSSVQVKNPETALLWAEAKIALSRLCEHLNVKE